MKANPGVTISGQPGEFNTYWDKLATQTAGGNAPDIIQMDMNYISEYGSRGALLDLSKVDVSKFVEGTVDSGKINGKLVGINAGINSALIFANPKVFEKAKMDLPDDKTWTWDQLIEVGAEVASKAGVPFGLASLMGSDALFGTFVRQHGKELFTENGLGFDVAEAQAWYDLMLKGQKAKAIGTPEQISGGVCQAARSECARGRDSCHAVLQLQSAGSGQRCRRATDEDAAGCRAWRARQPNAKPGTRRACCGPRRARPRIQMRQSPGSTGLRTPRRPQTSTWPSGASRRTPSSWPRSSPSCPLRSRQSRSIITDIKPEVATTPIAPPPGGGTIATVLFRHGTDVLFGQDELSRWRAEVRGRAEVEPAGVMP